MQSELIDQALRLQTHLLLLFSTRRPSTHSSLDACTHTQKPFHTTQTSVIHKLSPIHLYNNTVTQTISKHNLTIQYMILHLTINTFSYPLQSISAPTQTHRHHHKLCNHTLPTYFKTYPESPKQRQTDNNSTSATIFCRHIFTYSIQSNPSLPQHKRTDNNIRSATIFCRQISTHLQNQSIPYIPFIPHTAKFNHYLYHNDTIFHLPLLPSTNHHIQGYYKPIQLTK
jgi:hypothetical protein